MRVIGFWPAAQRGRRRHRHLRRRHARRSRAPRSTRCASRWAGEGRTRANTALADFIAPEGSGAGRLYRRFRGDGGHRRSPDCRTLRAGQRRLLEDHGQGAGRPSGRSLRRAHARARAPRVLGLCAGESAVRRRADRREAIAASARRPAIRPSPTTPRSARCSTCSTPRRRRACSSPRASP